MRVSVLSWYIRFILKVVCTCCQSSAPVNEAFCPIQGTACITQFGSALFPRHLISDSRKPQNRTFKYPFVPLPIPRQSNAISYVSPINETSRYAITTLLVAAYEVVCPPSDDTYSDLLLAYAIASPITHSLFVLIKSTPGFIFHAAHSVGSSKSHK